MQCPLLLVQPTRAHNAEEALTIAQGLLLQVHHVLKDTAGAMGHPSMMTVLAYVS